MGRTQAQRDRANDLRFQHEQARMQDVKGALLSLIRRAMKEGMHFADILERRSEIYARPSYQKLTQAHKMAISAYCEAMFDWINFEYIDGRLTMPDGTWVDAHDFPYREVNPSSYDMLNASFWKGTDRIYYGPLHSNMEYR